VDGEGAFPPFSFYRVHLCNGKAGMFTALIEIIFVRGPVAAGFVHIELLGFFIFAVPGFFGKVDVFGTDMVKGLSTEDEMRDNVNQMAYFLSE
jgi:hypothetical protein